MTRSTVLLDLAGRLIHPSLALKATVACQNTGGFLYPAFDLVRFSAHYMVRLVLLILEGVC
jgi:hypothetical protein